MGRREDVSTYFQRNGNDISFNYIESDGEGNGKFGPHIHLVRKTDWDVSHDSENLPFSTKDVLFQKAAAMSEVERLKQEISTLKQTNSTLMEKIRAFERGEMERMKEEIRRFLETEAVMSETRKELLEFLISYAGDAASKKTKSRTVKNSVALPQ